MAFLTFSDSVKVTNWIFLEEIAHNKLSFFIISAIRFSSLHPLCHKCTRHRSSLHTTYIRTIVTEKKEVFEWKEAEED